MLRRQPCSASCHHIALHAALSFIIIAQRLLALPSFDGRHPRGGGGGCATTERTDSLRHRSATCRARPDGVCCCLARWQGRQAGPVAGGEPLDSAAPLPDDVTLLGPTPRVKLSRLSSFRDFRSSDRADLDSSIVSEIFESSPDDTESRTYLIVSEGMKERRLPFIDRPDVGWNPVDKNGFPRLVYGADLVKTFQKDRWNLPRNLSF